jgi:hypothetical protein
MTVIWRRSACAIAARRPEHCLSSRRLRLNGLQARTTLGTKAIVDGNRMAA